MPADPPLLGIPAGITARHTRNILQIAIALSPAQVAANTVAEEIFAVAGVPADAAYVGITKPTTQAGLGIVNARVSSAGNIAIAFVNATAAPITPTAAEVYQILVVS